MSYDTRDVESFSVMTFQVFGRTFAIDIAWCVLCFVFVSLYSDEPLFGMETFPPKTSTGAIKEGNFRMGGDNKSQRDLKGRLNLKGKW